MQKLIVIGNYPPDCQQSMERFAQMLRRGAEERGITAEIWRPEVFFAKRYTNTTSGAAKWLGYLDKWVRYPRVIRRRIATMRRSDSLRGVHFHVADHSNAFYMRQLPVAGSAITCHDVLAIRGARGDADAYCPASRPGRWMQAWILRNLARSQKVAAVSATTLSQLQTLSESVTGAYPPDRRDWRVIFNGFNARFSPMPCHQAKPLLRSAGVDPERSYLLHVGSSLERKNRAMLMEMAAKAGSKWNGAIVFAGTPLTPDLESRARQLGIADRVIQVLQPDHETLLALYSRCFAFVFPSFSEGFGWPVIEAQACGAPVIASNVPPMPEVSGGAAIHVAPDDVAGFSDALLSLTDETTRADLIERGFGNCNRFDNERMVESYLDLFNDSRTAV
ncbi:Glycogen synthase [Stieleria maiorica]|uniref:Glycogen synthase n=1 Tax=Stieleria maiorica TaxID=2795974 RepID=A0A5B9MID4_9BACT|nr:glycosyltransferase family 1 protein [Stieleria maiorica]QEG01052.1 Glycogen synthase [Stieleria maiorica]